MKTPFTRASFDRTEGFQEPQRTCDDAELRSDCFPFSFLERLASAILAKGDVIKGILVC